MSDELVTVAKFETAFEAEAAKDCLEENDIKATVVGGDLVSMMVPMPEVNVEVKVFEKDLENAKAVLENHHTQCENALQDDQDVEESDCQATGELDPKDDCSCDTKGECGCQGDASQDA